MEVEYHPRVAVDRFLTITLFTKEKAMDKFLEDTQSWLRVRLSFIIIMFLLYGSAMVILIALLEKTLIIPTGGGGGIPIRLDVIWLLVILIYTALGIKTNLLKGNELIGSKFIFGRPTYNVKAGLIFVPLFVCKVESLPGVLIGVQIGTKQVIKDKDGKTIDDQQIEAEKDVGMMFKIETPFRVNFAHPEQADYGKMEPTGPEDPGKKEKEDKIKKLKEVNPLEQQLTTDPVLLFLWRIEDATQYLTVIGDRDSIKSANRQMGKVGQGCLSTYCARHTPAYTSFHQEEAEKEIRRAVENLIGEDKDAKKLIGEDKDSDNDTEGRVRWGVALDEVNILTLGFPHDVNLAIAEARAAGFKKQERVTLSEAQEAELTAKGRGDASAAKSMLVAQAEGGERALGLLAKPNGALALQLTIFQKVVGQNDKLIFGGGSKLAEMLAEGMTIGQAVKPMIEPEATPPAPTQVPVPATP